MLPTKADRVRKADALGDGTYLPRSARIDNFFGVKKRRRGRVITSAPHASSGPTPSTSTSTSFPASSYLVQDTVALSSKLSDLVLFSTGDINGEPSSPPRSSLPGPLSPPSPSSSTTLVSNSGPSPPPAYLPAPTHVPVPLASVNASAAQTSLALVSLNLDTDVIFQGYPSMTSIFLRLNDAMSTVVRGSGGALQDTGLAATTVGRLKIRPSSTGFPVAEERDELSGNRGGGGFPTSFSERGT
ncbi:MAG: hypothetical protein NXY57DRAFT_965624 [Lentinula lateritia]|nr:MAG: hypothetical protein NXY57DRAFT_965624 [Lentinula lateritia]